MCAGHPVQARQVGEPDQKQRRLRHKRLLIGGFRQACLAALSSTATTLQVCRFDELGADCAAATSVSSVPGGKRIGR